LSYLIAGVTSNIAKKKVGGTAFTPHPLFSIPYQIEQKIFRIVDYYSPPPERVRPLLLPEEERLGVLLRLILLPEEERLGLGL
jgi:hypothetical protein